MDFKKEKSKRELKVELCPQVICSAEKKIKKGLNLLKHVLFSCTSKVDAFNPAGKHITSQFQLNVSQSKMIFNSNKSFGAEPIKRFC